jgi:hypothetical protein
VAAWLWGMTTTPTDPRAGVLGAVRAAVTVRMRDVERAAAGRPVSDPTSEA